MSVNEEDKRLLDKFHRLGVEITKHEPVTSKTRQSRTCIDEWLEHDIIIFKRYLPILLIV